MSTKQTIVVGVFLLVILLVIQQIVIRNKDIPTNDDIELKNSIEELSHKIDSISDIRDSIIVRVDSNKVKIVEIERKYEKTRDRIITQSIDSDCVIFSNYISNYNARFPDYNNQGTIKNSESDIQ